MSDSAEELGWRLPVIIILILISSLVSGLTLGLLGLDKTVLQVMLEQVPESEEAIREKQLAKQILPVRKSGNLLLCTLVTVNVAVNAGSSILMAELTSGLVGFVLSTVLLVIFAEILPQAVCAKYGLWIGAKTAWITRVLIYLLYIITKPLSIVLDWILGDDPGTKFTDAQMKALFKIYEKEERMDSAQRRLLTATLDFADKRVDKIMKPLKDVYMLEANTRLTSELVREIYEKRYSRIPIYQDNRENIIGILMAKDLMFVSPEKLKRIWKLKRFFIRPAVSVHFDEKLQNVLHTFKQGKSHIALVKEVVYRSDSDPIYRTVGIITMEDIIEALLQEDIQDEHDIERELDIGKDFSKQNSMLLFANCPTVTEITKEERLAIITFLATNVEPFNSSHMTYKKVKKLVEKSKLITLTGDEKCEITLDDIRVNEEAYFDNGALMEEMFDEEESIPTKKLYERGKKSPYFYMVLSGNVEAFIGEEQLEASYGPFRCLGVQALVNPDSEYYPDYNAVVNGKIYIEHTRLIRISQGLYKKYCIFRS